MARALEGDEGEEGEEGQPTSGRGLARRLGVSLARVQQHLKFVEAFAPAEVADLPLPWSAVVSLLAVRDLAQRADLLRAAVAERWSSPQVRREVRLAQPPVGHPIRHRRVAADVTEVFRLAQIASDWLARWEAWRKVLPDHDRWQQLQNYARAEPEARPSSRERRDQFRHIAASLERAGEEARRLAEELRAAA